MNVRIAPALKIKERHGDIVSNGEVFLHLLRIYALRMCSTPQTEDCNDITDGLDLLHELSLSRLRHSALHQQTISAFAGSPARNSPVPCQAIAICSAVDRKRNSKDQLEGELHRARSPHLIERVQDA